MGSFTRQTLFNMLTLVEEAIVRSHERMTKASSEQDYRTAALQAQLHERYKKMKQELEHQIGMELAAEEKSEKA
jgi:hypothetical protein